MKLLLDMNLTPRWVPYLEAAGFEAVHWSKIGRVNAPDEEIMAYAAALGLVVLTHDLDFSAMPPQKESKPSVVQLRAHNISPEAIGPSKVVAALRHTDDELELGALLTIDPTVLGSACFRFTLPLNQIKRGRILPRPLISSPCSLCFSSVPSVVSLSLRLLADFLRHSLRLQETAANNPSRQSSNPSAGSWLNPPNG